MKHRLQNSPVAYGIYLLLVVAVLFEITIRVFFAFEVGPRVLLYGTSAYRNVITDSATDRLTRTFNDPEFVSQLEWHNENEASEESITQHLNEQDGYTTFFPNEVKFTLDVDTQESIRVRINGRGFRGPEFSTEKPEQTVRVLTLGASSTFGFYDRDDETYPYYMDVLLKEECPSADFEVINFAIPHMSSSNIAALYFAEALELSPDVVTFYQGRNDSMFEQPTGSPMSKVYSILVHRLLSVAFIDQTFYANRESVTAAGERFEPRVARIAQRYLENLSSILDASRQNGVRLIVANQQSSSASPFPVSEEERLLRKGETYAADAAEVRRKLEESGDVNEFEYSFLIHEQLMLGLRSWAQQNQVTFVDVIDALDQDRHYLLSWVHLHPEANKIIAAHLVEPILDEFCSLQL